MHVEPNRHSELNYFDNIFAHFASEVDENAMKYEYAQVYEDPMGPWRHVTYHPKDVPTLYHGYFQTAKHFEDVISRKDILDWLGLAKGELPSEVLKRYPGVTRGAFIHVRRGDYLTQNHIVHHINQENVELAAMPPSRQRVIRHNVSTSFKTRTNVTFSRSLNTFMPSQ